jgi:WD40 repeat protein
MLEGALALGQSKIETSSPRPSPPVEEREPEVSEAVGWEEGARIGRYLLLQKIGEGGFGSVFMAEQETPVRRLVALKIIKVGMDTRQVVARFEAERQALALMDHPNIARVLDAGATDTGRPYFVMELVRGIKVTEYCIQNQLATRQRLDLFVQVCNAVQHAHQKGIIHRDLKPSNLLVTIMDGEPVPKVIDFGIAKATGGQRLTDKTLLTGLEQFIGTPAYMSPEQAEMSGVDVDTRTDIYSLGVVLYELLTGKTPFDGEELRRSGLDEIRRTIRESEPPRPSTRLTRELTSSGRRESPDGWEVVNLLRRELDWVVMKCLEKDPNRRYETASALAADVQRHLNGEAVAARPPTAVYRFQKLVRRNRFTFAAGAAVAAALLCGAIASTWQAIRATNAQRAQQRIAEQAQGDLWKALLAEARALRLGGGVGRKARGLEAIAQAARIRTSPELVNEAIAMLALFDLNPGTNWTMHSGARGRVAFDHALEHAAIHTEDGAVTLWRLRDGAKLHAWNVTRSGAGAVPIGFTADDRYMLVRTDHTRPDVILDTTQPEPLRELRDAHWIAFSPDSRRYACQERGGEEVVIREIADGQALLHLEPAKGKKFTGVGAWHPSTNLLAIAEGTAISIWLGDSGKRVSTLNHESAVRVVAMDGPWLAAGASQNIRLWNLEYRRVLNIAAHEGTIDELWFFPRGELLVSHGWDGDTSLWHPSYRSLTARMQAGVARRVSPDGSRVGIASYGSYCQWDVSAPIGRRELPSPFGASWANFSPDGTLLATWDPGWVALYDMRAGKALPGPNLSDVKIGGVVLADFLPDNRTLLIGGTQGLVTWTFERDIDTNGPALRWGDAQRLAISDNGPFGQVESALVANGTRVALQGRDITSVVLLPLSPTEPVVRFTGRNSPHSFALSPDCRWLATGTFHGQGPCIWNGQTGELLHDLEIDNSRTCFSPDGRVLLIGGTEFYRFLEVGTWRELHRIPTGSAGGVANQVAWSADGRLLAIAHRQRQVKLLDGHTWEPLVELTSPHEVAHSCFLFSPDGRQLAVCRPAGPVEIWDLPQLSAVLNALGLHADLRQGR